MMVVDGIPNTRTCVTMVKDGMKVETQKGLARIADIRTNYILNLHNI